MGSRTTRNSANRQVANYVSPYSQASQSRKKPTTARKGITPLTPAAADHHSTISHRANSSHHASIATLMEEGFDGSLPVTGDQLTAALDLQFQRLSQLYITKTNELKARIDDIDNDISEIRERVSALESVEPDSASIIDDVCLEMLDKMRRAHNILLHGFPEATADTDELVNINTLLQNNSNLPLATSAMRLGNRIENKTRPLKLKFSSPACVNTLFKNKTFFDSNKLKISNDQTPRERAFLLNLRTELNERILDGERNLTIKYVNGIPKIVIRKNM